MSGFNLSDWVLKHRSFTIFLMIIVSLAGLSSYKTLGRNEDPAFTFRTMIVQAAWPGATLDETLQQVTERIERKLQEMGHKFVATPRQMGDAEGVMIEPQTRVRLGGSDPRLDGKSVGY